MPIIERDPWREQYFDGVFCPDDVVIPPDDEHAYELWPEHRWISNLSGMGVGGMVIRLRTELAGNLRPGHMWMVLLDG